MNDRLPPSLEVTLTRFARALVNQQAARVIISPRQAASGFWFGGGNLTEDPQGNLYLVGRYRNAGDSRTGLGAGERGLELAVFRSSDRGATFTKIAEFSKSQLDVGDRQVLSIEGSALHWTRHAVELFVSTEKSNIGYPPPVRQYLKPGTGVWTVDHMQAASIEQLSAATLRTIVQSNDPQFIHSKDPVVYQKRTGELILLFCCHPYNWSSSNTALAVRRPGERELDAADYHFFPRGFTWDVAIARVTCVVDIPRRGRFADGQISLLFYDGGEALRRLDAHAAAVQRPRGYSCEELGGLAYVRDHQWHRIQRLSPLEPMFFSPWGTGCSRYVDVLASHDGYYASWQQSQPDLSQPLVMNFLGHHDADRILDG